MANRIPPPDPEANRLSQAKKMEEARKVKEVSEVDPDEQARKRQIFEQMMDSAEETEKEETSKGKLAPSPFQTSFYEAQKRATSELNRQQVPSPAYSPPPNLTELPPISEDQISSEDLPKSDDFYHKVPLPGEPVEKNQPMAAQKAFDQKEGEKGESEPGKKSAKKGVAGKQEQGAGERFGQMEKGLEPSPFGVPGKPVSKKEKNQENETSPFIKKQPKEEQPPSAKYWEQPLFQEGGAPIKSEENKKQTSNSGRGSAYRSEKNPETDSEKEPSSPKEFSPFLAVHARKEGESGGGKGREQKGGVEIIAPTLPGLPSGVQSAAASAATSAASYLSAEVLPLFYQMVGTILIMTNQGISTTEILLNNPAFADSKFFGASIEIIKYSTAPDSLNIRLSGTNEAVASFNQNIPGLMAAFQTGGFRFRIGRIDAVYATEKPTFHRKEEKNRESKDESGKEE